MPMIGCDQFCCRYCSAAADYLQVPPGNPDACHAAVTAARVADLAVYDFLRGVAGKKLAETVNHTAASAKQP